MIATIYKKLTMYTHENIGWGKIHIPEQELQTTSFWLSLSEGATAGWPKERVEVALAGLGNLLHGLAPHQASLEEAFMDLTRGELEFAAGEAPAL